MDYFNTDFVPHIGTMVYPSDQYSNMVSSSSRQFTDRSTQTVRYHCQKCDSRFTSKYFLRHHESSHNVKFICPFCPSMFSNKNDFKTHVNAHDEAKLLPCSFCNKIFHDAGKYEAHIKIHTEKPVISCSLCPAQFWQASAMRKHITLTHRKPKFIHIITEDAIIASPALLHYDDHITVNDVTLATTSDQGSSSSPIFSGKRRFFKSRGVTDSISSAPVNLSKNLRKRVTFVLDDAASAAGDLLSVYDFEEDEQIILNNTSQKSVSNKNDLPIHERVNPVTSVTCGSDVITRSKSTKTRTEELKKRIDKKSPINITNRPTGMTIRSRTLEIKRNHVRNTRSRTLATINLGPSQKNSNGEFSRRNVPFKNQSTFKQECGGKRNISFFLCHICNISFKHNSNLKKHMKIHTRKKGNYSCKCCAAKFSIIRAVNNHQEICIIKNRSILDQ